MLRIIFILSVLLMSACSAESANEAEYDTTKKMVVDIIQTDDGKKALKEIMNDEDMKKQIVIESDTVKKSINDVMTSEKGAKMWTELFKDPARSEEHTSELQSRGHLV